MGVVHHLPLRGTELEEFVETLQEPPAYSAHVALAMAMCALWGALVGIGLTLAVLHTLGAIG